MDEVTRAVITTGEVSNGGDNKGNAFITTTTSVAANISITTLRVEKVSLLTTDGFVKSPNVATKDLQTALENNGVVRKA